MPFKLSQESGSAITVKVNIPANTTIVKDTLLALDVINKGVIPATSASTTALVRFVAQEALTSTSSATKIRAILIESGQIWEADCTNATLASQLFIRQVLTDAATVNNSTTDTAGPTGVFEPVQIIGATGDKKLRGLIRSFSPTA